MRWATATLREVAPARPARIGFNPEAVVWHLNLDQIESGSSAVKRKYRAPACAAGASTFEFDTGNVLFSKLRPYLNKVVLPDEPGIATTELVPLRPERGLLMPAFFAHYLRSPGFLAFSSSFVTGVKMPRVIMEKFWQAELPLPPLSEQRRIVEILDRADELRRLRAEANTRAERILPALFLKMFGDPATNPMGWEQLPLGELVTHLTSGSRGWSSFTGRGPGLFVRTQDILDGQISQELLAVDPPHGAEADRTRLADGDVVVTITGIVGKAATFHTMNRDAYVSQHVALVRPDHSRILPEFLTQYANLPIGPTPVLATFQYGQTKPGLGFRELNTARIPVPPLRIQRQFQSQVLGMTTHRHHIVRASKQLSQVWATLLSRAFSGDLTASWREAHMKELLQEMEQQARDLARLREATP